MPTISAITPEGNAWCCQQNGLSWLTNLSGLLKRRRNLAGGLRSQKRMLIDPTCVLAAKGNFCRVVTQQAVVFFCRHNPWPDLQLGSGPASFCESLKDFIEQ
jgi:hypothetical protein